MPKVTYYKPNRTLPRVFTPRDIARLYCRLVDDGIPRQVINEFILIECPEDEERKKAQAAQQALAAALESGDESSVTDLIGGDDVLLALLQARDTLRQNALFFEEEERTTRRQLFFIDIIKTAIPLLRLSLFGIPIARAINSVSRLTKARLDTILPIKAQNDAAFNVATNTLIRRARQTGQVGGLPLF